MAPANGSVPAARTNSPYVFDVRWLDGQDLRPRPLIERKRLLRDIIPEQLFLYSIAMQLYRRM
jgi:ATP-dependent DNA ligase